MGKIQDIKRPWWLLWVNFLVVQWFFVRIAIVVHADGRVEWHPLRYVIPLTGWWSNYVWLWRKWPATRRRAT